MTHSVDRDLVTRLFSRFANKYGKLWTTRLGDDGDWNGCLEDWFEELRAFTLDIVRNAVNEALAIYRDYPPTQGQLIDLCLKHSGIPSQPDVIKALANRDFSHPMIKLAYDKIGSWELSNAKSESIKAKVQAIYTDCLLSFKSNPDAAWKKLNAHKEHLALAAPELSKIPSTAESKAFRECMNKCQEILRDKKINAGGKTYKEFDENKIKTGGREFDKEVYNQWKDYLLSIPETETMILPTKYAHARMKFISAKEQPGLLRKAGYNPNPQVKEKVDSRVSNGPSRMYKNYSGD